MQIDEPAVDAAAAASGFTGVVAIDAGDQLQVRQIETTRVRTPETPLPKNPREGRFP